MIGDPLFVPGTAGTGRSRRRRSARSARILAVGLSTSTMFALTAAYGAAAQQEEPAPLPNDAAAPNRGLTVQQSAAESVAQGATPADAAPRPAAPQAGGSRSSTPKVVQIPVDTVAPAQPGTSGGNNQSSSGSR